MFLEPCTFLLYLFICRQGLVVDGGNFHLLVNEAIDRAESTLPPLSLSSDQVDTTGEHENGIEESESTSCAFRDSIVAERSEDVIERRQNEELNDYYGSDDDHGCHLDTPSMGCVYPAQGMSYLRRSVG